MSKTDTPLRPDQFDRYRRHLTLPELGLEGQKALLESSASEQGARMTAMKNASENAEEMIDTLTLDLNRARQSAITQEILEVVAGADALK